MAILAGKYAKWIVPGLGIASAFALHVADARAAMQQEVTGRVSSVTRDTLIVRDGNRFMEFDRKSISGSLPEDLKVGDRVTVKYRLQADEITRPGGQQPGRVAPKDVPSDDAGQIDDRAFYSASNSLQDGR